MNTRDRGQDQGPGAVSRTRGCCSRVTSATP